MEYRQLLIQSIHICAIKFSDVAASVVHALMEFLGEPSNPSAVDVIAFVREVVEKFPNLRKRIVENLLESFADIKSGKVFRGAMWIVGEYCAEAAGEFRVQDEGGLRFMGCGRYTGCVCAVQKGHWGGANPCC